VEHRPQTTCLNLSLCYTEAIHFPPVVPETCFRISFARCSSLLELKFNRHDQCVCCVRLVFSVEVMLCSKEMIADVDDDDNILIDDTVDDVDSLHVITVTMTLMTVI